MSMLQLYPDSLPDYPKECALQDLGFQIVPHLGFSWISGTDFNSLADFWVVVSIVVFLLIAIFVLDNPQLIIRRWFIVMSILFVIRGLVIVSTRYPGLPYKATDYRPSNPWAGALLILSGVHSTAKDIMFSGHTVNWIITASFMSRYSYYGLFSHVFWVFNILGILSLIAVREHYSADILVAVFISKLVFWVYHLFFDSWYKRFWIGGFELETLDESADLKLEFPAQLVSRSGKTFKVSNVPTGEKSTFLITPRNGRTNPAAVPQRVKFYLMLRWLDYE